MSGMSEKMTGVDFDFFLSGGVRDIVIASVKYSLTFMLRNWHDNICYHLYSTCMMKCATVENMPIEKGIRFCLLSLMSKLSSHGRTLFHFAGKYIQNVQVKRR